MKKRISIMLLVCFMAVSFNVTVFAAPTKILPVKQTAIKISTIRNQTVSIYQNEAFSLPNSIKATLVNKKETTTNIVWDKKDVKTDVPGTFKYTGKVKNYAKVVTLTLVVKKLPVTITSIGDLTVEVFQNAAYILPSTAKANLSDNSTGDVTVTWSSSAVKTDVIGTYNYVGKAEGYSKDIKLSLVVKPIPATIVKVSQLPTVEIKQNDKYTLPQTVTASMSDNTQKNVNITWNKQLDPSNIGLNKFEGKVDGYNSVVNFNVVIRGLDLVAPEKFTNTEAQIGDMVGITGSLAGYSYDHFGIYIGDGNVIEYSSPTGKIQDATVSLNPLGKSFLPGKYFVCRFKNPKYSADEIVKRAKSRLGEKKYDLIGNNCENFAVWCQTDVSKSFQIDSHSISDIELLDSLINSPLINIK